MNGEVAGSAGPARPQEELDSKNLGRLRRVAGAREVWVSEALDFTPWLTENIDVLGDAGADAAPRADVPKTATGPPKRNWRHVEVNILVDSSNVQNLDAPPGVDPRYRTVRDTDMLLRATQLHGTGRWSLSARWE